MSAMTAEQADAILRCCCNTNKLLAMIVGQLRDQPRRPTLPTARVVTTGAIGDTVVRADPSRTMLYISSGVAGARVFPAPLPPGVIGWAPVGGLPLVISSRDQCDLVTMEWQATVGGVIAWAVLEFVVGCFSEYTPTPNGSGGTSPSLQPGLVPFRAFG